MEAKLIKTEVNYLLKNEEGVVIAATSLKKIGLSLSLKNCQTIERGYDLDKLFQREIDELMFTGNLDDDYDYRNGMYKGAKILLEILADKKYSEEQMKTLFAKTLENAPSMESHTRMISDEQYRHSVMDELYDRITKSLQQTEWDVEIEMNSWFENGYDGKIVDTQPKLDANGCIILKRK